MKTPTRLLLDSALLSMFILANSPRATGLSVHEWLCAIAFVPVLVHTIVNWDWTVNVVSRFFTRCRAASRVNLVVDVALFVTTIGVTVSGLMVSRVIVPGFGAHADALWHSLHSLTADLTFALVLTHTALHWRWFARALGLSGSTSAPGTAHAVARPVAPQHSGTTITR